MDNNSAAAPAKPSWSQGLVKTLEQLRWCVHLGAYPDDLPESAKEIEARLPELKSADQDLYKEALGILSEINDYYDQLPTVRQLIAQEGKAASTQVADLAISGTTDLTSFKRTVWLAIHYSQSLYREERYRETRTVLLDCEAAIRRALPSEVETKHDLESILGRIRFMLGQTDRHLHDFETCEKAYVDAIECCQESLQRRDGIDEPHLAAAKLEEQLSTNRKIGLCCLGLALSYIAQGRIRGAHAFIISARGLLISSGDWLNKAYVDLVSGGLKRAEAGFDKVKVEGAIKTLRCPLRIFEARGMERYKLRIQFQIALACTQAGRYDEAEETIDYVLAVARRIGNDRWTCKGVIVKSRISRLRQEPRRAELLAREALEISEKAQLSAEQMALAYIARAAARIDLERFEDARQDLRAALRAAMNHPQTRAVVHLHFATGFVRERNLRLALKHFAEYKKLEPGLESAVVRDLAKRVRREIESRKEDFLISREEHVLSYDDHEKKLRQFLIRQARQRCDTHNQMAKALGISRQTLYNWLSSE
jgi:tetratricopeptide (TPR) repeat protein